VFVDLLTLVGDRPGSTGQSRDGEFLHLEDVGSKLE
jgi:hypothetical protein